MSPRVRHSVMWVGCLLLAGVFLAAAVPKISDPTGFAKMVYGYKVLPSPMVNTFALVLAWLELVVAVALFVPALRRPSLAWIGALMAVFLLAQFQALVRGIDGACGCFSTAEDGGGIGLWGILRNVGLVGVVVATWWAARGDSSRLHPGR
jgi:putative oxidoreductase